MRTVAANGSTTITCDKCAHKNRIPAAGEGRPRCGNCGAALPWIVEAGDSDFEETARKATPFVLVDLWATWCQPCRMVSPALERVAHELAGQIKLVKVDVDQSPSTAQRFQVRAVPTLLLLDKGEEIARQAGAAAAPALRKWVEESISGRR